MANIQNLPKRAVVFIVLVVGVAFIVLVRRPHTPCDSQVELLQESQAGYIFPTPIKTGGMKPPLYEKALANCKLGQASPGACYEYFKILNKLTVDLENFSPSCGE